MRVLRFLVLNGIAVGLGATVATSCIDVDYPIVAFRCNPRQSDNCPETHFCCSDDPASVDGALPEYQNSGISGGVPYFSGLNNGLGTSGMCVQTSEIPSGSGLFEAAAANCPIPCNPTWGDDDTRAVCGNDRVCCQTVELEPTDCILDGDTWRPVTGVDFAEGRSRWEAASHETHQDPGGSGCITFAQGVTDINDPALRGCVEQLSVADQRGFCMALAAGQGCPTDDPGYINACDQINMGLIPPPF
ncbi:MAG: hypothetical protein AAGA54_34490 [Myxococcota bacterium]